MAQGRKSSKIFYGWWIVVACFIMAMYSSGIVGHGFTAVFKPIADEFGWSYAEISWASSVRGMEVGILAPVIGILVDRFGAKPVIFTGGVFTGLGLLVLSRVSSLWMFYAAFALIALGSSACSITAMMAAVASWFHRKIGLTMGIMICGFGSAGLMVPVVVKLVDSYGWRPAMIVFGLGSFVILLPLSLLLRRRPEDYGYLPDGDATASGRGKSKAQSDGGSLRAKEALKTPVFWYIALAMAGQHLIVSAVSTHVMPYLESVGFARALASLAATFVPVASIAGRFSFGWLGERTGYKRITVLGFALIAGGLLAFSYTAGSFWLLMLFLIAYGVGFGGTNTMRGVLSQEYFGVKNFGTILGFVSGVGTLGSVIGAPLAGYVYDKFGSYQLIWLAYTALAFLSMLAIAVMPASPEAKASPSSLQTEEVAYSAPSKK